MVLTFTTTLMIASPARAGCSLLDVGCVAQAAGDAAGDAVDGATDTVDDVVDGVTQTTAPVTDAVGTVVDQVVSTVEETVEEVVDLAGETVQGAVDGVTPEPRPGSGADEDTTPQRAEGESRPGAAGSPTEGLTDPTLGAEGPGRPAGGEAVTGGGRAEPTDPIGAPTGASIAPADPSLPAPPAPSASGRPTSDGSAVHEPRPTGLIGAMTAFAFPAALALVVALFLLAQHRLDRRAPKLALAPVEADVIGFRRASDG